MKKLTLLLFFLSFCALGYAQMPVKRIDSLVKIIESKKTLTVNIISDTFPIANSNLLRIESRKFYSADNKLLKVVSARDNQTKDAAKKNIQTRFDIFYFNNDLLIKVISRDFDQSPVIDIQFYLNEAHHKKFLAKATKNFSRYEGANYFVETGYSLLNEFKLLHKKVSR